MKWAIVNRPNAALVVAEYQGRRTAAFARSDAPSVGRRKGQGLERLKKAGTVTGNLARSAVRAIARSARNPAVRAAATRIDQGISAANKLRRYGIEPMHLEEVAKGYGPEFAFGFINESRYAQ